MDACLGKDRIYQKVVAKRDKLREEKIHDWLCNRIHGTGHSGEAISTEQVVSRTTSSWRVKTVDAVIE